jgi:hypothetical protein
VRDHEGRWRRQPARAEEGRRDKRLTERVMFFSVSEFEKGRPFVTKSCRLLFKVSPSGNNTLIRPILYFSYLITEKKTSYCYCIMLAPITSIFETFGGFSRNFA